MHTAEALIGFLILFLVALIAFANFFYVIEKNVPPEGFDNPDSSEGSHYV